MRGDLRSFADQSDIRIGQQPTSCGDTTRSMRQESRTVGVLPGRFAGWEVSTDIALGQRSVDCVAQRMDADIGIRMAGEASVVRDDDAAEYKWPARLQNMDIEPRADVRDQVSSHGALQPSGGLRHRSV